MRISNIKTVSAKATRIGRSKKETIHVDNAVYIKSCSAELWGFLVICEADYINYITGKVEGKKTHVLSKHKCVHSANYSIEAVTNSLKKGIGYDLNAIFKVIEIERG